MKKGLAGKWGRDRPRGRFIRGNPAEMSAPSFEHEPENPQTPLVPHAAQEESATGRSRLAGSPLPDIGLLFPTVTADPRGLGVTCSQCQRLRPEESTGRFATLVLQGHRRLTLSLRLWEGRTHNRRPVNLLVSQLILLTWLIGLTLRPPLSWRDCPGHWQGLCPGGGPPHTVPGTTNR